VGVEYTDALKKELILQIRKEIGPIAAPDLIHWAPALPKTRSGEVMRRILRKIASTSWISWATRAPWPIPWRWILWLRSMRR
jgi:acyl-coenzyme A synthetase/AMP-(fatty) acid ligase